MGDDFDWGMAEQRELLRLEVRNRKVQRIAVRVQLAVMIALAIVLAIAAPVFVKNIALGVLSGISQ